MVPNLLCSTTLRNVWSISTLQSLLRCPTKQFQPLQVIRLTRSKKQLFISTCGRHEHSYCSAKDTQADKRWYSSNYFGIFHYWRHPRCWVKSEHILNVHRVLSITNLLFPNRITNLNQEFFQIFVEPRNLFRISCSGTEIWSNFNGLNKINKLLVLYLIFVSKP